MHLSSFLWHGEWNCTSVVCVCQCASVLVAELICLLCVFISIEFSTEEFQFKLPFGQHVNGMRLGILSLHQKLAQVNTMSLSSVFSV